MQTAAAPLVCAYCKRHRWCTACNLGHDTGEACTKCGAELEAAPRPVRMAPLFDGAQPLTDNLHDQCAKVVHVLREHQALLASMSGHAHLPYDAALRRVVKLNHTGWLDVRFVFDEKRPKVIESRVQIMLRGPKEPQRNGWASVWISPDFVELIHKGMDLGQRQGEQTVKPEGTPDLDVDCSAAKEVRETSEELS